MNKLEKIRHYLGYLWKVKWLFVIAIATGMISASASGLGFPVIISKVFPIIFGNQTAPEWIIRFVEPHVTPENVPGAILLLVCLMIPLVFIIRGVATFVNGYLVTYIGTRVLEDIRMDLFTKLQSLPLSFHEHQQKGDLISRMLTDTQNVQTGITQVANDLIKQPFTVIACLAGLFYLLHEQGQMGGILIMNICFVALIIIPIYVLGRRVVQRARNAQSQLGELTAVAQENLASQREIRSYSLEKYQTELFHEVSERFLKSQLKTVKYRQFLIPSVEVISALGLSYILVVGRLGGMVFSSFLAIATAIYLAFDALKRIGVTHNRFKQAQASLERLDSILQQQDTMPDPVDPVQVGRIKGDVRFDNVSFSYDGANDVLKDINIHIPPGQVVGLVGPSGAGKTTFASLIPRFYDATQGAIKIDGTDIRKMKKNTLRSFIALVSQHAILFRNTIKENIRLGRRDATDEEVLEAARDASVTTFTDTQPEGLDTMLGEMGEGLSGGQRQRVAIARAFLRDAPILILDEATASLDAESESLIQEELQKLTQNRTTFIVAHRFSTIRNVDRILVFSGGRIVGDGTHDELYKKVIVYKELYDRQSL